MAYLHFYPPNYSISVYFPQLMTQSIASSNHWHLCLVSPFVYGPSYMLTERHICWRNPNFQTLIPMAGVFQPKCGGKEDISQENKSLPPYPSSSAADLGWSALNVHTWVDRTIGRSHNLRQHHILRNIEIFSLKSVQEVFKTATFPHTH